MYCGDYIFRLVLDGREKEAQVLAARIVEAYREDPSGDGTKVDGKCNKCDHVFSDEDCQHAEIEPFILCDRCYLNLGGK